ncbi:hypothetical protein LTS15_001203 [Exophiala xenobiotica]|nr:hypothetical protein LTS15_001203 [Exophiala xenobiotica]
MVARNVKSVTSRTSSFPCTYTGPASDAPCALPTPAPSEGHASSSEIDQPAALLNMEHLQLLHHFVMDMHTSFSLDPEYQKCYQTTVVKQAFAHPFLMYELLAISALHIGHTNPGRRDYYHTRSTELQSLACSNFNATQEGVSRDNCAALMLFSSLLSLHALADRHGSHALDSRAYLQKFFNNLKLMQSISTLVMSTWHSYLSTESDIKILLNMEDTSDSSAIYEECQRLTDLVLDADMEEPAHEACLKATQRLQWSFAVAGMPYQAHTTIRFVIAWPVQLSEGYLNLLSDIRPEALIILAYYAVFMHQYRETWAVGNTGVLLLSAIRAQLESKWLTWLEWPYRMLDLG